MKHYTDKEIIEGLDDLKEDLYVQCEQAKCELMVAAIERIEQKQKQLDYMRERLDVAANIIGHSTISEAQYEGY